MQPSDKHAVQLLGINLLQDVLWGDTICGSIAPVAAARVVQRRLVDAGEAVCQLAICCSITAGITRHA